MPLAQGEMLRMAKTAKAGAPRRVPLTIMLNPENQDFVDACVDLKEFDSVDKVFDAAITFYRRHVDALKAYTDEQSLKGYSRSEIMASVECETLVIKALASRARRR
jgi:hypothetical protein